jgi:hypothetical protein
MSAGEINPKVPGLRSKQQNDIRLVTTETVYKPLKNLTGLSPANDGGSIFLGNNITLPTSTALNGDGAIVIGTNATITANPNGVAPILIGYAAQGTSASVIIGQQVTNSGTTNTGITAVGPQITIGSGASNATAIGLGVTIGAVANATSIGRNSSATASNSVAYGASSLASGSGSNSLGYLSSASGIESCSVGYSAISTGIRCVTIGSSTSTQGGNWATAIGYTATANIALSNAIGVNALTEFPGETNISTGQFSNTAGTAKSSIITLFYQTTNATPTELASQNSVTSTNTPTGFIVLANDSSYIFNCDIIARNTADDTTSAAWNLTFAIRRGTSASTTTLIGTPISTTIGIDTGAATWAVGVTADTTNGRPNISVTGAAATTIRWVANIRMTKVTG